MGWIRPSFTMRAVSLVQMCRTSAWNPAWSFVMASSLLDIVAVFT